MSDEEKLGGPRRNKKCMEDFRQMIDDCEVRDIIPRGELFTWKGTRRGNHVWEKLDRFLCNNAFDSMFKVIDTINLDWMFSDHRPTEIGVYFVQSRQGRRHKKPFRFEEYWTKYDTCSELIT